MSIKLIWWHDYTTEAQDQVIKELEENYLEEVEFDHDTLIEMLQTVAEKAYAEGYRDALGKEE